MTNVNLSALQDLHIELSEPMFHTYTMEYYYNDCRCSFKKEFAAESVDEAIADAQEWLATENAKEYDGIYFDQLQELFTDYTGLYTRLF